MIKTIGKFAKRIVTTGVPIAGKALVEVPENDQSRNLEE